MAFLNNLFASSLFGAKIGVWQKIIMAFNSKILNYAAAIIVITLVIKILMLPFDFLNKKVQRKNSRVQAMIQPELEVIKKKYGNDKNIINQKTMELYKKHNYNVGGSCGIMLLTMAFTLFIFISLFAGLNNMAAVRITEQYDSLRCAYYDVTTLDEITEGMAPSGSEEAAAERVVNKYKNVQDKFLWIENVWMSDSPFSDVVPSYKQYAKLGKLSNEAQADEAAAAEYDKIMAPIKNGERKKNGYLILAILVAGLSFLQQFTANKSYGRVSKDKLKNETKIKVNNPSNKIMMIMMPLLMGVFAVTQNSVFALYLLMSSVISVLTGPLLNLIVDKVDKKQAAKAKEKNAVTYRRK